MNGEQGGERKQIRIENEEQYEEPKIETVTESTSELDEKEEGFSEINEQKEAEYGAYQEEAQKMIEGYKSLFATFAGDISLRFTVSDKFMINFETGEVHNDARWFSEKGCSMPQVLWAKLHELSHFRDFAEDTDGMLSNFDEMWQESDYLANEIYRRYEEASGDTDEETLKALRIRTIPVSMRDPLKKVSPVELAAYKMYHTFYNIFDDIYVNNIVARHAPRFAPQKKGGEEVKHLYRDKLFQGTDYANLPRHLQFLYTLLREEMVSDEKVVVSGEVEDILNKASIEYEDEKYTPKEIIEKFIKPRRGRDTMASKRYDILKKTLLPLFEELVEKDVKEWKPQKFDASGGKPMPFAEEYEKFAKNTPDQLNDEEVKEWSIDRDNARSRPDAKETTEAERAKAAQEALDSTFCKKFEISPELFREYKEIEAKVEPYRNDLRELWMKIVYGSSQANKRRMVGHFEKGVEVDIEEVLKQPEILVGHVDDAPVMKKMASEKREVKRPELIRARVVVDDSSSMETGERMDMAQQMLVLIMSSLQEFNAYLDYTRSATRSKMQTDTEGWVFGGEARRIKDGRFSSGRSFDEEQAEIIRVFGRLSQHLVSRSATYDDKALEAIERSLGREEEEKMAAGKLLEMVFVMTDGASNAGDKSRAAVDSLLRRGVHAHGFQIGDSDPYEIKVFDSIWNDQRSEKLGVHVGERIENLIPAVAYILKEYMRDIRV